MHASLQHPLVYLQLQQAIAASLLDVYCPNEDVQVSVDLQAQQLKEFEYYQQRQWDSQQVPDTIFASVPKAELQLDSQIKIHCQEFMGSDCATKLQHGEQAATPPENEEGSQASTTSAEPSLSAQDTSGATFPPIGCSQALCIATSSLPYYAFKKVEFTYGCAQWLMQVTLQAMLCCQA